MLFGKVLVPDLLRNIEVRPLSYYQLPAYSRVQMDPSSDWCGHSLAEESGTEK